MVRPAIITPAGFLCIALQEPYPGMTIFQESGLPGVDGPTTGRAPVTRSRATPDGPSGGEGRIAAYKGTDFWRERQLGPDQHRDSGRPCDAC